MRKGKREKGSEKEKWKRRSPLRPVIFWCSSLLIFRLQTAWCRTAVDAGLSGQQRLLVEVPISKPERPSHAFFIFFFCFCVSSPFSRTSSDQQWLVVTTITAFFCDKSSVTTLNGRQQLITSNSANFGFRPVVFTAARPAGLILQKSIFNQQNNGSQTAGQTKGTV